MKILKIMLGLVVLLIVIIGLLILALPKMISSTNGKEFVLQKVNQHAPGTLEVDVWSLGWGSGLRIEGLSFQDEQGRPVATVKEITFSKSLLALVKNWQDLGELRVMDPQFYVYQPDPAMPEPAKPEIADQSKPSVGKEIDTDSQKTTQPVVFPDMHAHLIVANGAVYTGTSEKDLKTVVQNIEVDVDVGGWKKPIRYDLSLAAGEAGEFSCRGEIDLGDVENFDADQIDMQMKMMIQTWQIEETLNLLSALTDVPQGSGMVSGIFELQGSQADGVDLSAELKMSDLQFSGGPFKEDHPSIPSAVFVAQGRFLENALSISNVTLRSNLMTAHASGEVGTGADGTIQLKSLVDLAEISRQFPSTLGLKDSLKLEDAELNIDAKLASMGHDYTVDSKVAIAEIVGSSEGKQLALDQPMTLTVRGAWGRDRTELEILELESPFMTVDGKGDMRQLNLTLASDLGEAWKMAKQFVDVEPWDVGGSLNADVNLHTDVQVQPDGTLGNLADMKILCHVSSDNLAVKKGDQRLIPAKPQSVKMSANVKLDESQTTVEILAPSLTYTTWLGGGEVKITRVVMPGDNEELPTVQGVACSGNLDLDVLQALLRELQALPANLSMGGRATWNVDAGVEGDVVRLGSLGLEVTGFQIQQDDKSMPEQDFRVTASGTLSPKTRNVAVSPVQVDMDAGAVIVEDLAIDDWNKIAETTHANIAADLDVTKLLTSLGNFVALPDGREVQGQIKVKGSVVGAAEKEQTVDLNATVAGLRMTDGDQELFHETDDISLVVKCASRPDNVVVHQLTLQSSPMRLNMKNGTYSKIGVREKLLAQGEIAFDLDAVTTYITALLGLDIMLTGKEERPFAFSSNWDTGEENGLFKNAYMDVGFHADTIRGFGFNVADLDVPLSMSGGVARVDVSGLVNEGQLTFRPTVDFNQGAGVITLPNNSNVLTSIQLTEELANELLAKIHPLFKGATGITGDLNMHMETFHWPVDAEEAAARAFKGQLDFSDLKLGASGLWFQLLKLMKIDEREMEIGDSNIAFDCHDERVHCSPFKIGLDGHEVVFEGSIGFDQTLDYYVKVPITESLAGTMGVGGNDYTNYLAGTTINVPIRGTASDPDISASVLTDVVADVAKQAAKKAAAGAVKDVVKDNIGEEAGKLLEGLFGR